ncbi:hypothetical protein AALP_AA8G061500 [Arabis alpina]|uniref:DRBM domain-containing protein n=1 Tax=Arabis alpina TaxID=50452 RepID=A0A087G5A9_ARAAL|nr:hypothetical protein AALP_AA8G061500 [Arabis alpina]
MFPISSPQPSQAMVKAPNRTPSPPRTRVVEKLMHKNDLNSYCQRLSIPIPVYETTVEGYAHALRFKATVSVGERSFTSLNMFLNRKSAEQDAAKVALEHLLSEDEASAAKLRLYLRKLVCQDKSRCKMIFNEFLAKVKMECTYETAEVEMQPPLFVSSLALNGNCYKGEGGKNKKEAEQLAALAAILSLLDDPTYGTLISEVVKSKFNVGAAFYETKDIPNTRDCSVAGNEVKSTTSNSDVIPLDQQNSLSKPISSRILVNEKMLTSVDLQANNTKEQRSSEILVNKNKQDLAMSLPQVEKQGGDGSPSKAVTVSRCSYANLPVSRPLCSEPQHDSKMPSSVTLEEQRGSAILVNMNDQDLVNSLPQTEKQYDKQGGTGLPAEAVTISRCTYVNPSITRPLFSAPQQEIRFPEPAQSTSQQISLPIEFVPAAASDPPCDPISSKKREKNKKKADRKKANKRLRVENMLHS